jgi:hypothetical protein
VIRRTLKRSDYDTASYRAWNAFVNLLAMEQPDDLTATQRHAHFAFWYDSELQNGGHLQYFENLAIQSLDGDHYFEAALWGLEAIGAACQGKVFSRASKRWVHRHRCRIESVEEYVGAALQGEFDDLDKEYCKCRPEITELLSLYFDSHFGDFVELI